MILSNPDPMKRNLPSLSLVFVVFILLSACAVSNSKFFANISESDDITYPYTPTNPVTIMNHNLDKSIGSSNYYVACLRSENGKILTLVDQKVISNPSYDGKIENMDSHYTGEALSYGNGPTLDLYYLLAEDRVDTIKIYINNYVAGVVKVPMGLKFKRESLE